MQNSSSHRSSGNAEAYRKVSQEHRKKEKDMMNLEPFIEKIENVSKALKKPKRCKKTSLQETKKEQKTNDVPVWIKMMQHPDNFSRKTRNNSYREF
jgi:hypothetical protein